MHFLRPVQLRLARSPRIVPARERQGGGGAAAGALAWGARLFVEIVWGGWMRGWSVSHKTRG